MRGYVSSTATGPLIRSRGDGDKALLAAIVMRSQEYVEQGLLPMESRRRRNVYHVSMPSGGDYGLTAERFLGLNPESNVPNDDDKNRIVISVPADSEDQAIAYVFLKGGRLPLYSRKTLDGLRADGVRAEQVSGVRQLHLNYE